MSLESMLRKAEKFGEAEIAFSKNRSLISRYNLDTIESGIERFSQGYSLRLNVNGRISSVSFGIEKDFGRALKTAVKMAKFSEKVKGYHFPEKGEYQDVKTWSREIHELDFDDLTRVVLDGIDGIKESRAEPEKGQIELFESEFRIENSNGLDFSGKENGITLAFGAKKKTGSGYDHWESGILDFDPNEIGRNAGKMAFENSKAKKIEWQGRLALHPDIIDEFLSVIVDWVNGDAVRKKTSPWSDKLGKRVLGKITLIEDPWIPHFPGSCPSDDEGVPTKKKVLLDNGLLKTFLYDTITARRVGTESTGNGFRHGSRIWIDVTNLVLDFPEREDMQGWDNYLLLRNLMGFHTINWKTGDFSLTVDHGILFKDNKEIPVKGSVFVGNIFDLFSQVDCASKKDYRRGDLISPYLMTRGRLVA